MTNHVLSKYADRIGTVQDGAVSIRAARLAGSVAEDPGILVALGSSLLQSSSGRKCAIHGRVRPLATRGVVGPGVVGPPRSRNAMGGLFLDRVGGRLGAGTCDLLHLGGLSDMVGPDRDGQDEEERTRHR